MLLINRIEVSDLNNYRQEYLECLKHNISNTLITKILIYTDDPGHNIPKFSSKVDIFYKKNSSVVDVIENAKRISSTENIIFSSPLCKFNSDIFRVFSELPHNIITDGRDYFIFHRSTFLSDIPNLSGIFPLNRKNISLNVVKSTINQTRKPNTPIFEEIQKKKVINRPITDKPTSPIITQKTEVIVNKKSEKKKFLKDLQKPTLIKRKGVVPEPNIQIENIFRRLDVVIVSVNYNDLLLVSLQHNSKIFDNITVVTSSDDILCQKICQKFGVNCVITDVMYEDNAIFNKGKAINEGIKSLKNPDFVLLIDADIIVKEKININELNKNVLYSSDRWICKSYNLYNQWTQGIIDIQKIGRNEGDKGIGFFQLFNISNSNIDREKPYPEMSKNAAWSDLVFRDKFVTRKKIENTIIHLGDPYMNWDGRVSNRFLTDGQFAEILNKKSTFTICSFYFNYNNDWRQKRNFIKFLEQWKDYYDNLIVGIVDYGDIDFEIPCEKVIIEGDINKKIWSKEILINKIVEKIDTDYILWIDGDIIYEDLSWLNNLDDVIGDNDFVQLFETINYLGENDEVLESHRSIASDKSNNVDHLLSKGYKPGGSWMTRTRLLKTKPLFEKMLVGGGDTILAYALFGVEEGWTLRKVKEGSNEVYEGAKKWIADFGKKKIGYLPVMINHLYHGDLKDRNYNDRYVKLSGYKKRGIMLICFGFEYEKITPFCIKSIRNFSNLPITIHTNIPDFVRSSEFDKFDNLRFVQHELNDNENRIIKTQLFEFSEYDETLYIDVDSEVLSSEFLELFDYLDKYEIVSPLWKNLSKEQLQTMRLTSKRYEDFYRVISDKNLVHFNFIAGGICAFKKTDDVKHFFSEFFSNWKYFGQKQDMPALNKTLIENKVKIFILNNKKYNLINSTVIKSNHQIGSSYSGKNFIRSRYNPATDKFEFVESDEEIYFTKKKICFLYDIIGWAFYNKSHNIKKYLNHKYEIDILQFDKIDPNNDYDVVINFSINLVNTDIKNILQGISSKKNLSLYNKILKYDIAHTNNKESFELLKNKNKFLLYNGVNTDFFYYSERKLKGEKIVIGAVGSSKYLEHKGYYRIKKIISEISNICEDKILFVNPKESKTAIEMRDYYQNIDLLLISSLHENTPNPLLEAMSCGIPVITNNTGMARELIDSGQNGFIIDNYDNLEDYIDKIKILNENRDIYNKFSILSRKSVENYSWEKMSVEYEKMIEFYLNTK
jgi:glycosyltransferase involved in cell wall biosynthesis